MLQFEASAGLLACLALLQQCQREAVYGAFFGGLTHAEMADRQGVPVGTMKSWVRRGLAKLREAMDAAELMTQPTN
jgi:DNA-directed RNA polymerase specialized sigma24 family protein